MLLDDSGVHLVCCCIVSRKTNVLGSKYPVVLCLAIYNEKEDMNLSPRKYRYFNRPGISPRHALFRNENIRRGNFLVAQKKQTNQSDPSNLFEFSKYDNVHHFYAMYSKLEPHERTFYVVWTKKHRYLYLDIDYKWKESQQHNVAYLIQRIIKTLESFIHINKHLSNKRNYQSNWYVWNASRCDKFSLHIINPSFILAVETMKDIMQQFVVYLKHNASFPNEMIIDLNVYTAAYQLFKLPLSYGKTADSELKLYNKTCTLDIQLTLHDMDNIRENHTCLGHQYQFPSIKTQYERNQTIRIKSVVINTKTIDTERFSKIDAFGSHWKLTYHEQKSDTKALFRQYKIAQHFCPIANRSHRSNEGYVHFYTIQTGSKEEDIEYIEYKCMDEECRRQTFRHSFDKTIHQPWIFDNGSMMNRVVLQHIEAMIQCLLKDGIIYNKNEVPNLLILKRWKIQMQSIHPEFSTFFSDDIVHVKCKKPELYVVHNTQNNDQKNGASVRCLHCQITYTILNDKIHQWF